MNVRVGVVGVLWLAACASHPPPAETSGNYLMVRQGKRAWPVEDQALVRNVEERLMMQGFDPGRVDGVADDRTAGALAAFQRSRGLPETGILDEDTSNALGVRWKQVRADVRAGRLEPDTPLRPTLPPSRQGSTELP